MTKDIDYTSPSTQYSSDVNQHTLMKKDIHNYINVLGKQQLNTLENTSLLDTYLSANNIVEPHYHQNASELVYCIAGALTVSMLNPFTKKMQHYYLTPGKVANIPQGWWHYDLSHVNNTHFLAIFDAATPEVILGSDILAHTPPEIMSYTYGLNEKEWKKATAPVVPSTLIGPPSPAHQHQRAPMWTHHPYPYQSQYPYR